MKLPAFQFYTGDWLKDPALTACQPATRGVWIDAIARMHELDRQGTLTGTAEQLGLQCRCTAEQIVRAVADLESNDAADVERRNGRITLTNRRMRREYEKRQGVKDRVTKHRKLHNVTSVTDCNKQNCENVTQLHGDDKTNGINSAQPDMLDCNADCNENVTPISSSSDVSSDKPPKSPKGDPVFEIPQILDTQQFRQAWGDWLTHRREIKHKLTPSTAKKQLAQLSGYGVDGAIASIEKSITAGWQGLFEPPQAEDDPYRYSNAKWEKRRLEQEASRAAQPAASIIPLKRQPPPLELRPDHWPAPDEPGHREWMAKYRPELLLRESDNGHA